VGGACYDPIIYYSTTDRSFLLSKSVRDPKGLVSERRPNLRENPSGLYRYSRSKLMTTQTLTLPPRLARQLKMTRTGFRFLSAVAPNLAGRIAANRFLTPRSRPISKSAHSILSQARHMRIRHGSRELAAYLWSADGPTILLVHGWESNAGSMRAFVRPLLNRGFRVIAFDAPAHGASSGRQTNIMDMGGAIRTIINKLGPVHGIVAHSFGAAATLFLLSREPDIHVNRVVSVGAPSKLIDIIRVWTSFLSLPEPIVTQMRRRLVDRVGLPIDAYAVETAVSRLTMPGLIIHDKNDTIVPFTNAEAIQRHWQSASLIATNGLDHRGALQNRDTIQKIVAFLASDHLSASAD
jgi:pimeloyl-ACP methyl ester carboxylesterase